MLQCGPGWPQFAAGRAGAITRPVSASIALKRSAGGGSSEKIGATGYFLPMAPAPYYFST